VTLVTCVNGITSRGWQEVTPQLMGKSVRLRVVGEMITLDGINAARYVTA
jgi:hypothetical protein